MATQQQVLSSGRVKPRATAAQPAGAEADANREEVRMELKQIVAAPGSALTSHDCSGSRNTTDLTSQFSLTNWMGQVDGSRCLSQLSIPATHNSLTYDATLAAQDQDIDIGAQLNAGIRWFDLRLAEDQNIYGTDILVGAHGDIIGPNILANTDFWINILTPTIQFLQANPTECIIYLITNCGQTQNVDGNAPTWGELFVQYMNAYGDPTSQFPYDPTDPNGTGWGWGWFYTGPAPWAPLAGGVPTLDQVRGKILLAFSQGLDGGRDELGPSGFGLDLSGFGLNAFGKYTNSTQLSDGGSVTFHVQGIYDDSQSTPQQETTAIQQNIQGAAANPDPHHWYLTSTNRASGVLYVLHVRHRAGVVYPAFPTVSGGRLQPSGPGPD